MSAKSKTSGERAMEGVGAGTKENVKRDAMRGRSTGTRENAERDAR
ncbi:MAG TPA: hypothetical protein VHX66_13415 [Solirubrobacteraceae bacterium]|jgi:hypothetical protein|nr:hypothetical protein [Solirubrobacteraceae bacterium]